MDKKVDNTYRLFIYLNGDWIDIAVGYDLNYLILKKAPFTRSKNITNSETYYNISIEIAIGYKIIYSFNYNETTGVVKYLLIA